MKKCSRCGDTKELGCFYRHSQAKDGHRGECKDCSKQEMAKYRKQNKVKLRESKKKYLTTPKGREMLCRRYKKYTSENPEKRKAYDAVNNAIKAGKITKPDACSSCGAEGIIDAHHPNYGKPLEYTWLCRQCHVDEHELLRKS